MPVPTATATAVLARRREAQNVPPNLTEEQGLAQLQRAVDPEDHALVGHAHHADHSRGSSASSGRNVQGPVPAPAPAPAPSITDGAGNPIVAGADYSSLRLLTRRQPRDPESVLQGLDTSSMDLSWTARESPTTLDPNGQPWRYPKKRGKSEGSNLDQFKDEITERTKNGQGCKAIAEAFIAMGVDTSVRAVARQRMKWGLRQRAKRKMTEQGIANIRKAHLEQAKRMANSDPLPVKRVRIRVMRKAEITRMTKEGMSAAQIADNLVARGVKLTRGAATVERLRTVWGLTEDTQRSVHTIRATARNQALKAQKEQFTNIATELGIQDLDAWVKSKMDEEVAQDARREYAYKLMGDARPKQISTEQLQRNLAHLKSLKEQRKEQADVLTRMPVVGSVPQAGSSAISSPLDQRGGSTHAEAVELSDDDNDNDDDDDDDDDDDIEDDVEGEEMDGEADEAAYDHQARIAEALQPMPATMEVGPPAPARSRPAPGITSVYLLGTRPEPVPPPVANVTGEPGLQNAVFFKSHGYSGACDPRNVTPAPPAGMPGRRPASLANIAPRPMPAAPRPIVPRPIAAQLPPYRPQKPEIDYMAQFGLAPYPCLGKQAQKYLTPSGLISTDGYEYLACPPQPLTESATPGHQPPPDIIRLLPPPPSTDYVVVPRPPTPTPPKFSHVPQPPLVIPPEEAQRHNVEVKILEKYHHTSQECLDMVSARAAGRPMRNSLTGLPPSLQDVQLAKEKLREVATALLAEL